MKVSKVLRDFCTMHGISIVQSNTCPTGISINNKRIVLNTQQIEYFEARFDNAVDTAVLHEIGHWLDSRNYLSREFYLVTISRNLVSCERKASEIAVKLGQKLGIACNDMMLGYCLEFYENGTQLDMGV